ncbi:hypothetical protein [Massilia genomosp. 1]|uniref:Transmembrane protein n=1 Tax=Massilia genomosp. 1 TaxID=2609280 RepID=A0ABX0N099_9BURK|nr:hypothetical protein [Massilia genomosp. 1]NHZ65763.1 hypothetical protein [Massilia genomosp. 1]
MNITQQIALTLSTVAQAKAANWRAFAALAGMLLMIGGMVAMMWFLSSQPTLDLRGWLCGGASLAGLALWRATLPLAVHEVERRRLRGGGR